VIQPIMKFAALDRFREKLARREPVYGLWVTLESASVTDMSVALGLDWVVIDAEHGHLGWREINEHVRATLRSHTVALVRLARRDTVLAKRALDIGADGIVVPWIESVAEFAEAVQDCRYPPEGRRGIGGERATAWGEALAEHTGCANERVLVVPIIESLAGARAVPSLCATDGLEVVFLGPADFSASAGHRGQWEGPGVAERLLGICHELDRAGRHCGVMATGAEDLGARRDAGFRMLGVGSDAGLMLAAVHERLRAIGRDRRLAASLDPHDSRPVTVPLDRPPPALEPDREPVVTGVEQAGPCTLQAGVTLAPLVGDFNHARGLFTGVVTVAPAAALDPHVHPCSEAVTLLEGMLEVTVAGRTYVLGPLDNIVIPAWLPHAVRNLDDARPARAHVALGSAAPPRFPASGWPAPTAMPATAAGQAGAERITRWATAPRQGDVGQGAEFVNYFNADLVPGLEMSGGFARFAPGGRLPAHVHAFDESICITSGQARCVVEGLTFTVQDCGTAMVPRGRVHYFRNDTDRPMDMIWVYAGPLPERLVVAERWAEHPRAAGD